MTMDRWIGKTAIVTGASAGIGAEVAVALANAGMVVVATARRLEKLQGLEKKLKGRGKILPFRCDVSKEQDLVNLIEFTKKNTGGVDVLINNAAVLYKGTITDCDGKNATTKEIEESFQTNVVVVIIGTRLAVADMVARNVKGHVIILNSLSPGAVDTDMLGSLNFSGIPALKTEDIANAIIYVLSTPERVNISELTIQPVGEMF